MGYHNIVPTVKMSHNRLLTLCTKQTISLAMTQAKKMLSELGIGHSNYSKLRYQRLVVETNGYGKINSAYDAKHPESSAPKYAVYRGLPCWHCELLIPLGDMMVRRRAGATSKYFHVACHERIHQETVPLVTEAEQAAMRMGLYPTMRIPTTR